MRRPSPGGACDGYRAADGAVRPRGSCRVARTGRRASGPGHGGADRAAAASSGGELAAEVLEGGRVGAVAGVGAVQQGQVGVGGDEQGEADDAQGGAALLAVAALGEGGLVVEGVDEGEEVGGVEEHLEQVDLEVAD